MGANTLTTVQRTSASGKSPKREFFELAGAIVDSIEREAYIGDVEVDDAGKPVKQHLVVEHGLRGRQRQIYEVSRFLALIFSAQLSEEELGPDYPIDFGLGNYGGAYCFMFRWPEDRVFDFARVRKDIQKCRDMLSESRCEELYVPEDFVLLGPFPDEHSQDKFGALLDNVGAFYSTRTIIKRSLYCVLGDSGGMFVIVPRDLYDRISPHTADFGPAVAHSAYESSKLIPVRVSHLAH